MQVWGAVNRHCSRADGLRVHLKKFHVISGVHVIRLQCTRDAVFTFRKSKSVRVQYLWRLAYSILRACSKQYVFNRIIFRHCYNYLNLLFLKIQSLTYVRNFLIDYSCFDNLNIHYFLKSRLRSADRNHDCVREIGTWPIAIRCQPRAWRNRLILIVPIRMSNTQPRCNPRCRVWYGLYAIPRLTW